MGVRQAGWVRAGFRRAGALAAGAGLTAINSISALIGFTTAAGVATLLQYIAADWTVGICRVYAVDGVNGSDGNLGYADPATSSAADYAVACALAGTRAKKTLAGLGAIFPRLGGGRLVEIVAAAATYTDAIETVLGGCVGYLQNSTLRGTRTDTTAGVTAFDGSIADCTVAGAVTAAGMNATGYNPDAATGTILTLTKVGGGSPAFAAEPAMPLMMCLRFDAATTTVAQRNKCYVVLAVPGATQVDINVSITRVATDVCYLEDGGVVIPAGTLAENALVSGSQLNGFNLVGVRWTGTTRVRAGRWMLFKGSGTTINCVEGPVNLSVNALNNTAYVHPARGSLTVGGGWNASGAIGINAGNIVTLYGLTHRTANFQLSSPALLGMISCVLLGYQCQGSNQGDANHPLGCGTISASNRPIRVISPVASPSRAGVDVEMGQIGMMGWDITNCGALPAIRPFGSGITINMGADKHGVVTGATGNNDVGLDLVFSYGCTIAWPTAAQRPTVTGALGDVRLGDGTIISWAALAAAITTVDTHGNRISGA